MTHRNKFGMFVHWGMYAVTELQDQACIRYGMDQAEYEKLQYVFNPTQYEPEAWVKLAKEAGMQYICFTAKHHDGFCMWDTKYSDYSIMHTPYGKDVLKMLADACEKEGMLLSLYYSIPDWNHPHAYNPKSSHQWMVKDRENGNFEIYREYIKNQITELLTGYGKIYTLFWDIPPRIEDRSLNEYVRRLQPGIYINNRGFDEGDFSTPEREYDADNANAPFPAMVEACNAIDSQSWGYRREADFYSYRHLLSAIDRIMVRGGSYLLNIGPRPDGTLDPAHAERIRRIGDWYRRMEGCLEEHEPDPFDYQFRGCSGIAVLKNGKTYFHFPDGIPSSAISMLRWPGLPKSVRLLNTGEALPFDVRIMPDFLDGATGHGKECLCFRQVPVDALAEEPVVVEVVW